jgi:protein involved in polysaccharide export with SLBB domain
MHKFYIYLFISISFCISSQELDETYLASLPEDIRKDVMKRASEGKGSEEKVYRSIDNPSDIKKKNLNDGIENDEIEIDNIYGDAFFSSIQTSFMPINSPNLDDTYVLDFGDVLSIQQIGQNDSIDTFPINRDGSINIPDIGKLFLAGLSLEEASSMIKAKFNQAYIGVEAFISLKNIRDVSILVSGDAFNPGIYTLNGSSNMLHALHMAGGISQFGSYRSIKLIRDEKIIDTIDIYDILNKGNFGSKVRLRSGDIIFVDPRANVVSLEGAFKRPVKYELLKDQNLSEAIDYANGITIDQDTSNMFLYRLIDGRVEEIKVENTSQFRNIKANDEDRVFIRKHSFRSVEISGAVTRPGNYKMIEGETIFDLIEKSGGYSANAFPEGAVFTNEETKKISVAASQKLYKNFIDNLLEIMQKSSSAQTDISSLVMLAESIKNSSPNGRLIVDLSDDSSPLLMKDGDTLFIPEQTNNIYIYGEVENQGAILLKDGADLDFYLNDRSKLKDTADESSIYILYPNGRTANYSRKRNLFANYPRNISIVPGSVIYIPRKVDNTLSNRISAQAYATILGNIGVALASISALNDN